MVSHENRNQVEILEFFSFGFRCHRKFHAFLLFSEYDDYNVVGSLTDDTECISPTDANQWIFDRNRGQSSLDAFLLNNEDIQEEDDEIDFDGKERRDSDNFHLPELDDLSKAKLLSCMEEIRNISGDSFSDKRVVEAIMLSDYDYTKALDMLLTSDPSLAQPTKKPKIDEVEKGMINRVVPPPLIRI